MQLDELFKGKSFITDLKSSQEVDNNGEKILLGRYGVWVPSISGDRHIIVEVGDNLGYLTEKYKIKEDSICVLK